MVFIKKLRIFEGFAGIGAVTSSISNLNIPYKIVGFSEIDKYSITSFSSIHNIDESLNWGDISAIDETKLPDFDLFTFGFPCQDYSASGKQKGSIWKCNKCGQEYNPLIKIYNTKNKCPFCGCSKITKTRSSLIVEALRIIKYKKPKFLLMENVKNLISKKFKTNFDEILRKLKSYGYNTYWKILNTKYFDIPQNRDRVFLICIRKDIDNNKFEFPFGKLTNRRLKDVLQENVDNKYFLSEKIQKRFKLYDKTNGNVIGTTKPNFRTIGQRDLVYGSNSIIGALIATDYKQPKQILTEKIIQVGQVSSVKSQSGKVYSAEGFFPTLCAGVHGYSNGNILNTDYRIRKLTPLECWRLQGFSDKEFYKAKQALIEKYYKGKNRADTQLYKQAGNSISVSVLEAIFYNLFTNYLND